ncbi:hypothetical protein GGR58DRAFT_17756 [Xylaria digitata]|nr:hypothetical protein GGR58DRAFT_17756 [Xylaria digitata]
MRTSPPVHLPIFLSLFDSFSIPFVSPEPSECPRLFRLQATNRSHTSILNRGSSATICDPTVDSLVYIRFILSCSQDTWFCRVIYTSTRRSPILIT